MYATVVVPLDGSPLAEGAIAPAARLAAAFGAELVLLSVVEREENIPARQGYLADRAAPHGAGISIRIGGPAPRLARAAGAPNTLLCLSTHGRGGLGRALLGSVAERVLQEAPASVLLLGPLYQPADPTEIMIALDGSRAAESAVPIAAAWARALHLPLRITATARPLAPVPGGSTSPAGTGTTPFRASAGDLSEGGHYANLTARLRAQGLDAQWDLLYGDHPAGAIAERLRGRPGVLTVVSAYGGAGGLALQLAPAATGPLLVVRAGGQESAPEPGRATASPRSRAGVAPSQAGHGHLAQVFQTHAATEMDSLLAYRRLASSVADPVVARLMAMVIEDEERHHNLLAEMEALLQAAAKATVAPPFVAGSHETTENAIAVTRAYIKDEHEGVRHLRVLARRYARRGDELVALLLSTMAVDSQKHELILQYILRRLEARR